LCFNHKKFPYRIMSALVGNGIFLLLPYIFRKMEKFQEKSANDINMKHKVDLEIPRINVSDLSRPH
jgi:hypothetical protein